MSDLGMINEKPYKGIDMNHSHKIAGKVAVIYIIIGVLWIFVTDYISMTQAKSDVQIYAMFQQSKGWAFIFITGIFLYFLIQYWTGKMLRSQQDFNLKDEQYQSLFKHNPDCVIELNLEGNFVSINPEAENLLGHQSDSLMGKNFYHLINWNERKEISDFFTQSLQGEAVKFETTFQNARDEKRIVRVTFLPIIVQTEMLGVYAIVRDITELRREEELVVLSEKLSVIGHLAASVAHEIRNPLTSLKGFVQLMDMTKEVNPLHTDIMLKEIDRINIISSELLVLGKKQDIAFRRIDLADNIQQVFTLMKAETNLYNIEMGFKVKTAEPIQIMADSVELKQLIINIVKNSIEAIKNNGEIDISLQIIGNQAVVSVRDNGVGMMPERLERIGEPFYSTKEKGTGIGLAICRKIVHRLEGELHFESEVNEGTTVTIRIPLATGHE
ncbi:PAS domain S-box protein [Peribacillus muralis]|uniref:ATP-binding protein n=1 Tax=Peribacillus muralis TaxID=264697 RepID=UPI001F4DDB22|nr:ATP-binding protein [Peribacillus muralis]MCK1994054.1 ATP-binding protein [Peribacillus muralis]MCK2014609.1 ATP-binding protein [Peribacillus muralis]